MFLQGRYFNPMFTATLLSRKYLECVLTVSQDNTVIDIHV